MYMVKVKQAFTLHWLGSRRPYIHRANQHMPSHQDSDHEKTRNTATIVGPCELEYRRYSNEPTKICLELVPELA